MRHSEGHPLRLGGDLHAVCIGDDVVALDLRRGDYLCLPGRGLGEPSRRQPCDPHALAERLTAAGLPCDGAPGPSPCRPPDRPAADLGDPAPGRFTIVDTLDALRATLDVLTAYRGHGLAELVAYIERSRAASPREADVLALARRFNRWVVLPPVPGKCLVRSFMLLRFLQRHDASADWVFGVATWPFRAHCWVQHEGVVLDDHHERLIAYTPLFAVRA